MNGLGLDVPGVYRSAVEGELFEDVVFGVLGL